MRNLMLVGSLLGAVACARAAAVEPPPWSKVAEKKTDAVKRGEMLVKIGGCNDCHTPLKFDPALGAPVPQLDRMLSGHPEGAPDPAGDPKPGDAAVMGGTMTSFKAPFGIVYTANLTPDPETGLGKWTEAQFIRAMREGKHRGEDVRPILPPMPWMNVGSLPDEDLKAVFAYLRSIPPVKNKVPDPKVPPPVLQAMAAMNAKIAAHP